MKILQPKTTKNWTKNTAEDSEQQNGSKRPEVSLNDWARAYLAQVLGLVAQREVGKNRREGNHLELVSRLINSSVYETHVFKTIY